MSEHTDAIHVRNYTLVESSGMEYANDDGTITVDPGEELALAEYEPASDTKRALLHAYGATDAQDVVYRLRYGGTDISFTSESPLGGINDPFSFTEQLGAPLSAGSKTLTITALNDKTDAIDLVARMHIETR